MSAIRSCRFIVPMTSRAMKSHQELGRLTRVSCQTTSAVWSWSCLLARHFQWKRSLNIEIHLETRLKNVWIASLFWPLQFVNNRNGRNGTPYPASLYFTCRLPLLLTPLLYTLPCHKRGEQVYIITSLSFYLFFRQKTVLTPMCTITKVVLHTHALKWPSIITLTITQSPQPGILPPHLFISPILKSRKYALSLHFLCHSILVVSSWSQFSIPHMRPQLNIPDSNIPMASHILESSQALGSIYPCL